MANQITVDIVADTRRLVQGVQTTNTQLNSLNQSVGKLKSAFGGLAAAFGFQVGISFLKDAIKGASDDQAAFKRLADLYGEDIDTITAKVNKLSSTFKVDDGEIAQYFIELKSAFSAQFDKFVPSVVEASATLALLTGKPLDAVIAQWAKTLRDGKITAQEVQRLGIDLTTEQEAQFNKLKTTAERLQFLLDIINSPENRKKALDNLTPYQKFNYFMERLRDTIGNGLLPILEKLFNFYDKLSPSQQKVVDITAALVIGLSALAAVLAPIIIAGSALVSALVALRGAAIGATIAQAAFNAVMFINPFLPIIAAIALVVVAIVGIVKNWDQVKEAFRGGVEAIKNAFNSVREWFAGLGDRIRGAVGNLLEIGKRFGSDIINGLVQGIVNLAMAPVNAIRGVISGVTGAIKGFLKIGSPSKVFAGFGENIVQGLAIGIDKTAGLAKKAANDVSEIMTAPFNQNLFAGSIAFPNMPTQSSRGNNITVNINAGLGTDPYELGRVVKSALDKYQGVNGR